jgi:uncharacterized membrane protein
MRELLDAASAGITIFVDAARENALWMGWNTLLALVPLAFALVLFRRRETRGPLWWIGATGFVLLLPNAPYVLTDVIHLFDDVRASTSDHEVFLGIVPVYGAFFAIGVVSYSWCIALARGALSAMGERWLAGWELALHALCAVGIYLGRVHRLDSWDVVVDPRLVRDATRALSGPTALVGITIVGVVIAAVAVSTRLLMGSALGAVQARQAR